MRSGGTCLLISGVDGLLGGAHAAAKGVRELQGAPLLAGFEGRGVVQLAPHVQREGRAVCVQRERVHLHQREVQVHKHLWGMSSGSLEWILLGEVKVPVIHVKCCGMQSCP